MRNQRTTLLAGIAALALIAGTGFAAAQDTSKDHSGALQPSVSTPSTKTEKGAVGKMGQGTQPNKMNESEGLNRESKGAKDEAERGKASQSEGKLKGEGQNAKSTDRMGQPSAEKGAAQNGTQPNQHAQGMNRGEKATKEKFGESKANRGMEEGQAAQGERAKTGASTAEQGRQGRPNSAQSQNDQYKGLQANASGATLNEEQRTRIRNTVINARGAPRVGSVDFGVNVGTVIPRGHIHIVPVPETLVRIEPIWRGFRYFIYEDELVIVDPHDMRIVAVVPV
jgi:Protein of unknown function (DUF1236)